MTLCGSWSDGVLLHALWLSAFPDRPCAANAAVALVKYSMTQLGSEPLLVPQVLWTDDLLTPQPDKKALMPYVAAIRRRITQLELASTLQAVAEHDEGVAALLEAEKSYESGIEALETVNCQVSEMIRPRSWFLRPSLPALLPNLGHPTICHWAQRKLQTDSSDAGLALIKTEAKQLLRVANAQYDWVRSLFGEAQRICDAARPELQQAELVRSVLAKLALCREKASLAVQAKDGLWPELERRLDQMFDAHRQGKDAPSWLNPAWLNQTATSSFEAKWKLMGKRKGVHEQPATTGNEELLQGSNPDEHGAEPVMEDTAEAWQKRIAQAEATHETELGDTVRRLEGQANARLDEVNRLRARLLAGQSEAHKEPPAGLEWIVQAHHGELNLDFEEPEDKTGAWYKKMHENDLFVFHPLLLHCTYNGLQQMDNTLGLSWCRFSFTSDYIPNKEMPAELLVPIRCHAMWGGAGTEQANEQLEGVLDLQQGSMVLNRVGSTDRYGGWIPEGKGYKISLSPDGTNFVGIAYGASGEPQTIYASTTDLTHTYEAMDSGKPMPRPGAVDACGMPFARAVLPRCSLSNRTFHIDVGWENGLLVEKSVAGPAERSSAPWAVAMLGCNETNRG